VKLSLVSIGTKIGSALAILVAAVLILGMLLHSHPGQIGHSDSRSQIHAKVLDSHAVHEKEMQAQSYAAVDD